MTEFLPINNRPAPAVMTPEEAVVYLRLDEGREMENALKALNRIVGKGMIRPCLIGKLRRYWKRELDRFVEDATDKYGKLA